jgi:hypothetical protein
MRKRRIWVFRIDRDTRVKMRERERQVVEGTVD